jgi:hypothetical protein
MLYPRRNGAKIDKIKLFNMISPGVCKLVSGGARELEHDVISEPGTYSPVLRSKWDKLVEFTYEFTMCTPEDIEYADKTFFPRLERARVQRPRPEKGDLIDLARAPLSRKVQPVAIGPAAYPGKGIVTRTVTLKEWRKPAQLPRVPPGQEAQDLYNSGKAQRDRERAIALDDLNTAQKILRDQQIQYSGGAGGAGVTLADPMPIIAPQEDDAIGQVFACVMCVAIVLHVLHSTINGKLNLG